MNERTAFCCNIHAMSEAERRRYDVLRGKLEQGVARVDELENGYVFRLRSGALSLDEMGEWVEYEQKCCPFLGLDMDTGLPRGPLALRVTGEPGVKEFIRMEFVGIKFN
jgi:hypothetical protein